MALEPASSLRAPGLYFAELAMAPGPDAIAQAGVDSYETLFHRNWLVLLEESTRMLRAYREDPGGWTEVTQSLPPAFGTPLPATARRITFCFDQSARMIIAEEEEGIIHVTRWDVDQEQYIQNVSFSGHDPQVVNDATWRYNIAGSDVLVFYLSEDRTQVLCRVQRELYATENLVHDFGTPVILDRVVPLPYRYELLTSDPSGTVHPQQLVGDMTPYYDADSAVGDYQTLNAAYALQTYIYAPDPDGTTGDYQPTTGVLTSDTILYDDADAMDGDFQPVTGSLIESTVIFVEGPDALDGSYTGIPVGVYTYSTIHAPVDSDAIEGSYDATPIAEYREA